MATLKKFKNLEEIKQYLNRETQGALEDTLKVMRAKLKGFIIQDVYNAYDPIFYKRTRWLLRAGVLDYYISHMFGKVYGGIRINNKGYPVNIEKLHTWQESHLHRIKEKIKACLTHFK